jgi:hypothetical protein
VIGECWVAEASSRGYVEVLGLRGQLEAAAAGAAAASIGLVTLRMRHGLNAEPVSPANDDEPADRLSWPG